MSVGLSGLCDRGSVVGTGKHLLVTLFDDLFVLASSLPRECEIWVQCRPMTWQGLWLDPAQQQCLYNAQCNLKRILPLPGSPDAQLVFARILIGALSSRLKRAEAKRHSHSALRPPLLLPAAPPSRHSPDCPRSWIHI